MAKPATLDGYSDEYTIDCERVLVTLLRGFAFKRQIVIEASDELVRGHRELVEPRYISKRSRFLRRCSSARSLVPNSSSGSKDAMSALP
jgi:hypothetical protein